MNYIKVPNNVFKIGLRANELVAITYLMSIHKPAGQNYVTAKYEAIAAACGYASKASAMAVIKSLSDKGLITIVPRYDHITGVTRCNGYVLHISAGTSDYFRVDRKMMRRVASLIGTTGTAVYLYLLRCANGAMSCFPSLSAIRDAIHVTIATIIAKLKSLQSSLLLRKQTRLKLNGSYTHNLYNLQVSSAPVGARQREKRAFPQRAFQTHRRSSAAYQFSCLQLHSTPVLKFCQHLYSACVKLAFSFKFRGTIKFSMLLYNSLGLLQYKKNSS